MEALMRGDRRSRPVTVIVLIWTSAQLALSARTSSALEKPLHASLAWLFMLATLAAGVAMGRRRELPTWSVLRTLIRENVVKAIILTLGLWTRIIIFKFVVQHSECKRGWLEVLIPLIMVILDAGVAWLRRRKTGFDRFKHGVSILACAIYGLGGILMFTAIWQPSSTYICPRTFMRPTMIPLVQFLGVLADVVILRTYTTTTADEDEDSTTAPLSDYLYIFSFACSVCIGALMFLALIWYIFVGEDREWVLSMTGHIMWPSIKLGVLLCLWAAAFVTTIVQWAALPALFISISSVLFDTVLSNFNPLIPQSLTAAAFSVTVLFSGPWVLACFQAAEQESPPTLAMLRRLQKPLLGSTAILAACWMTLWCLTPNYHLTHHPIDDFMRKAEAAQTVWAAQAAKSHNLREAVAEYQRRYYKNPPPFFDKWYNFAVKHKSVIIDDYDSISRDLSMFTQIPPHMLRRMTREALVNEWDDLAGISIRGGKATPFEGIRGTHMWMINGMIDMISKFVVHLPDMDLAFNLNDEPRVTGWANSFIPSEHTSMAPVTPHKPKSKRFSDDRAAGWHAAAIETADKGRVFDEHSWQNVFADYGAFVCSSSRTGRYYSDNSRFCASCAAPHSKGIFLADWTASTEICSQLDLGRQTGFYASPASFKGSHEPYPVFSQSKAPYYADILYPSPWNYLEKAEYRPSKEFPDAPFAEKQPTLFWRGGTTDGFSHDDGWRGFARDRFVDVVSHTSKAQLLPLPLGADGSLAYQPVPMSTLRAAMHSDVRFTPAVRCFAQDCEAETLHFSPLAPNLDFQAHWGFKYLLDLDGAGFSGRFLPFLRSRSLPFKAALFREWYDDRVRAWRHFVPLDLRAHGLWATLSYFAGFKGVVRGRLVDVQPRTERAEEIAMAGREWAEKVLRREDMEVYMFRLLLEWGRLTDDARDEIGYV